MKKVLVYLMLLSSLVGFSQTNKSKYRATFTSLNGKDSVVYFNSQQEMLSFYNDYKKKRDEFVNRPKKVYNKNLNFQLVEKEFSKLYLRYQDSVFHTKKEYGGFLDSLSYCQLKYLTNLEYDDISHEQNNDIFRTMNDRFNHYYTRQDGSIAEILILSYGGKNEYEVSKEMFYRFLASKPHKKIIDKKELKYYNFKFGYNKFGHIVGIGTFSETPGFLK